MVTPPAKTPRKPAAARSAAAKPATTSKPAPAKSKAVRASKPKPAAPISAPEPFVIDPDTLSAFVQESGARFAPVDQPPAKEKTVKAVAAPVVAKPVAAAPVAEIEVTETSTPPQPDVAEPIDAADGPAEAQPPLAKEGTDIMNEAIETTKKFAEDAKARVQTILVDFNEKAKAAAEKSSKAVEELGDITKGNLEAFVESSKIAAKGAEALGQSAAEYGRSSFEKTSATLKSFASVKSPAEFLQLQSDLLSSTFDALASQTAKNSEAMLKLAGEIAQPISNRVAVVSDKFKSIAA